MLYPLSYEGLRPTSYLPRRYAGSGGRPVAPRIERLRAAYRTRMVPQIESVMARKCAP